MHSSFFVPAEEFLRRRTDQQFAQQPGDLLANLRWQLFPSGNWGDMIE